MSLVLLKRYQFNEITKNIITQLINSATSIGVNYCEADCAETRKDFEHKLGICKKESRETKHWLRMIASAVPALKDEARKLWKETNELNLIFIAIVKKSRKSQEKQHNRKLFYYEFY